MAAAFQGHAKGEALMAERTKERGIFEKVEGSGTYWIRFTDGRGKYRREIAGSYSQARKLLDKRRGEALQRKKLPDTLRAGVMTFAELVDDALAYSRENKRSYRDDESRGKRLKEWFGDYSAESLSSSEMEERLWETASKEKWAASTFNHYRSLLMLTFREARLAGKVLLNPARDIRKKKENNSRVRYLTRADEKGKAENGEYTSLAKVIREEYPEHFAEFIFALSTGLRLGSQYGATYEMIDWTRNVLDLPRTKNDEPVHVPLNADALAAIRSLPSWAERKGPIFRNQRHPDKPVLSNDHWFKPAMKAAGIVGFRWHDLRHTFASWLIQDGVPLDRVSKLLGHKGLAMTMRYAHLAPNQLHADVARLVISTPVAPEQNRTSSESVTYLN